MAGFLGRRDLSLRRCEPLPSVASLGADPRWQERGRLRVHEAASECAREAGSFRTSPASFAGRATPHPALIPQEVPEASGTTRESPQRRKSESPAHGEIPAYPRSTRKCHDRPVTPEVAGSSPVAPVKYLQITSFVARVGTKTAGLHGSRVDPARESGFCSEFSFSYGAARRFHPALIPHAPLPGGGRSRAAWRGVADATTPLHAVRRPVR